MRQIIFFALLIFAATANAQIRWTAGIPYTTNAPTHTPSATGSLWAIDTATLDLYAYYGGAWNLTGERIQTISGCTAPAYTPGKGQSLFVINGCDSLYYYRSGSWAHINPGGTGGGGGATNLSLSEVGNKIQINSNTGSDVALKPGNAVSFTRSADTATIIVTIDSTKITNGAISVTDINQSNATLWQTLKWNGTQWAPAIDSNVTNLTFGQSVSPFTLNSDNGTDVSFASGSGITLSRGGAGNQTLTITATDASASNEIQNLSLTGQSLGITSGTGVTLPIVGVTAGTGISVSATSGNATVTNSAPDQTVAITGTGITVGGTYPNFTLTAADQSTTNEGRIGVGIGGQNSATILTNTSGSNAISIEGSGIIAITETPNTNGGTITLTATEVDGSTTNEIQNLSLTGQSLGITSGTGVTLPVVGVAAGTGLQVSSSSGTHTLSLSGQARDLHDLSTNGILARVGADNFEARSIIAGTGISVTNGDGINGNITIATTGTFVTDGDKGDITVSASGATWSLDAGVVDSSKITNGAISVRDIGQHNASTNQVLKWNGTQWAPAPDETASGSGTTDLTFTGTTSPYTLNSSSGTDVTFAQGSGIALSRNNNELSISATDASTTNEGSLTVGAGTSTTSIIQSNTSGSTNVTLEAGANIFLSETGNTINIDAADTDLNFSGNSSPYFLNSSTGSDVSFAQGSGITLSRSTNQLTITATDQSATNEIQTLSIDSTITNGIERFGITIAPSGNTVYFQVPQPENGDKGEITVSSNGTGWSIDNNVITNVKIADNAIDSNKIADGKVGLNDINSGFATNGQVLKWNGSNWRPGADDAGGVSDGDKGDITVSASGATWNIDAGVVANTELASGSGGIYKGSGDIPNATAAKVASAGSFTVDYNDGSDAIKVDDQLNTITLLDGTLSSTLSAEPTQAGITSNGTILNLTEQGVFITGDTIDITGVTTKLGFPGGTGTVTTSGSPTTDRLAKFTGSTVIGNSLISDNGSNIAGMVSSATGAFHVAAGTDAQRPGSPLDGYIRKNTTNDALEYYNSGASAWEVPLKAQSVTGLETAGRVLISNSAGRASSDENYVYDVTNNRVGIGTNSPSNSLTVSGPISTGGFNNIPMCFIRNTSTLANSVASSMIGLARTTGDMADGYGPRFLFCIQDSTFGGINNPIGSIGCIRDGADNNGALIFQCAIAGATTTHAIISNSGMFGIGTTTPTSTFQVFQPTTGPGTVTTTASGTTVTGTNTKFTNTFKVGDIITVSGETARTITSIASDVSLTVTTAFSATERTNVAYTLTGGSILAAKGNGNVGIGVTSPTAALHLKAGTATANSAPLKFTSGTNLTTAEAGAMEYNGTNLLFTPSTVRHTVNHGLTASATLDFASTNAQTSTDLTITVTGAADGDVVSLGVPNASVNANTCYTAWVSATNTVTVRFNNYSSAAVNPASGTFKVFVTK